MNSDIEQKKWTKAKKHIYSYDMSLYYIKQ